MAFCRDKFEIDQEEASVYKHIQLVKTSGKHISLHICNLQTRYMPAITQPSNTLYLGCQKSGCKQSDKVFMSGGEMQISFRATKMYNNNDNINNNINVWLS